MLRPFLWYRAPALLYAAALFALSSTSRLPFPVLDFRLQDKLVHAVIYALFSFLIYRALAKPRPLVRHLHVWAVLLGIAYAITDEVHQYFVPGRLAESADLLADTVGIVVVQVALAWRRRRLSG